jgi:hypothetical protein
MLDGLPISLRIDPYHFHFQMKSSTAITPPPTGATVRQSPCLVALGGLLIEAEWVAAAIDDNSWEDREPLPIDAAIDMLRCVKRIRDSILRACTPREEG